MAKVGSKKLKVASEITAELAKKAAERTKDYSLLLRPLEKNEKFSLTRLAPYLNQEEYATVASWLKQNKANVSIVRYGWSFLISGKDHLPKIISKEKYTDALNEKIQRIFFQWRFQEFAERAWGAVPQYVAPEMIGNLEIKQAAALQLFSPEPLHVLLIGSQESGKNEIINTVKEISDYAYGTPEDGVCIIIKDKKIFPGLLRRAGNGLCIVKNLARLRKDDEVILYRTLETGYVSYNTKLGRKRHHVAGSILTEVTPREPAEADKNALPLDPYLVSKFHIAFFVKQASLQSFSEIAEKLILEHKITIRKNDMDFIKKYARFAKNRLVEIPPDLAEKIKEFAVRLKTEREPQLPYKISPQLVVGIVRLAKASARMELRNLVNAADLDRVFRIYDKATKI